MNADWIEDESPKPVPAFPAEVEAVYDQLWQEVAALNFLWNTYLEIYGTRENMKVINSTARGAFKFLEKALRSDMVMTLCRLLDPMQLGKRENLTLSRLVEIVTPHMNERSGGKIGRLLAETQSHCEPFGHLRNKQIGHNDLTTALKFAENPLPGISKPQVSKALTLIGRLMNTVETYFNKSTTMFDRAILAGSGEHLMFYLKRGLEAPDPELEKYR